MSAVATPFAPSASPSSPSGPASSPRTPPSRPAAPPPAMPRGGASITATVVKRTIKPRERRKLAPKIVFNATEKFGKTTLAAYAPSPLILMARGETGYDTLLQAGSVPQIPAELVDAWPDLLGWVDSLLVDPQGIETLVLDAIGGFETLCQEFICQAHFDGDWGDGGFMSYHKGFELSAREWLKLLSKLEQLNLKYGIVIIMLGHVRVGSFKNPSGSDYNQYEPAIHKLVWEPTAKWADAILFGNFYSATIESKKDKLARVLHTNTRQIWTVREGAVIAGNRYGMPPKIQFDDDPKNNWPTIWQAITDPASFGTQPAAEAVDDATEAAK